MYDTQILQASITWKQCANLPIGLTSGVTTVINGKVYCGGGVTGDDGDYIVCCYDPSQDKWTTLPSLPIRWFGLGQVNGKLVAVGGQNKIDKERTNKVHTYDERSRKWKQTIPPMPTARDSPGVLSLQSALVVAGGDVPYSYSMNMVLLYMQLWLKSLNQTHHSGTVLIHYQELVKLYHWLLLATYAMN